MAKTSPYESGELTDSIFLILLTMLRPVHGYGIMQTLSELTDGEVVIGPATMYTTLKKMKAAGWISEEKGEDAKIVYQVTEQGREVLDKDYARRKLMMQLADRMLGGKNNG
ncbi:MAG: PadR family transcriptional regulator [Oscillospiraceae bacterium]|nr:PadR family transcriptional regulator [Oscillospiraceae bacterium]